MKLYLMRHGDYASSDITKPLTQKGVDDINRIVSYLQEHGAQVEEIWHSPKMRAVESAEIMGKVLGCEFLQEKEYLTPNASPRQALEDLVDINKDMAIVSHLPFIPHLLSELFPGKMSAFIALPASSVVIVERVDGQWQFGEVITLESF